MGKPEDVKLVQKLPLIVVMEVEDPATVKKLTRKGPEALAEYKEMLSSRNEMLKSQFLKYWKFSPEVQLMRYTALDSLLKKPTEVYSVVRLHNYQVNQYHRGRAVYVNSNNQQVGTSTPNTRTTYPHSYTVTENRCGLRIQLVGKGRSTNGAVVLQQIEKGRVFESDISFAARNMQRYLENRLKSKKEAQDLREVVKANGPLLKQKTLLLDEDDVRESLTMADIKAVYPYPCKIVSRDIIEDAVSSEDPAYACVRMMPISEKASAQAVLSTDTGELLGYSLPGYGTMLVASQYGFNVGLAIKKSNLKDFAEFAAGK